MRLTILKIFMDGNIKEMCIILKLTYGIRVILLLMLFIGLTACAEKNAIIKTDKSSYQVEIRRTNMGMPHIKANDWGSLGYGYGYAQAQDNLCTMADSFLTYRGERSEYFGGEALPVYASTVGNSSNLDSDFYHRHIVSDDVLEKMKQAQPKRMKLLVEGFASGYNRYVREIKADDYSGKNNTVCRKAPWVKSISAQDIYRRMYAVGLAEALSISLLPSIANATPPTLVTDTVRTVSLPRSMAAGFPRIRSLTSGGIGSNAYGFGSVATGTDSPLLLGNPHWYLMGPDRFYLAQLTIPGVLNVSGAAFLGSPVVQIGFNDNVAWSHTVSTAERAGFFELRLMKGDPFSYLHDGNALKMQANTITVQVKHSSGALMPVTRTLYKSEYGPIVSNPMLPWSENTAFALRNINQDNFRPWRNWLRWSEAKSLDEFIIIQREEAAMPWVNTVAVGRGSSQAWYADIGAVPNISPIQVAQCTTIMGKALIKAGHLPPNTPFLDGSRSICNWQNDSDSVQLGAVGPSRMPSLLRKDYVANMNDSYWLSNPQAPLTGYPAIFGSSGEEELSLRTRMGHVMVQERLSGSDGYPGRNVNSEVIRKMSLNSRVFSAERFKTQVLDQACVIPLVSVQRDVLKGESFVPEHKVNLSEACAVLRSWDNTGNSDARGAHVWDGFWMRLLIERDAEELFAVPFDSADPLNTPRDLRANAIETLRQALGATVLDLQHRGLALNAKRGDYLYLTRGDNKMSLFGGCDEMGYFTISCNDNVNNPYEMDRGDVHSNSYVQVVSFPHGDVEAYVLLASSLTDDPASPYYSNYTHSYSTKQWQRMPFTESQISADPNYQSRTIWE